MEKQSNPWSGRSNSLPRGTAEDLARCGMSGKEYGSCSEPTRGTNIGCARWAGDPKKGEPPCPFRAGGPTFVGVEILKEEPGVGTTERQTILTCWDYLTTKPLDEDPHQVWTLLGTEGTKLSMRVGVKQPLEPGQTVASYKDDYEDGEVPHFIRCTEAKGGPGRIAELRAKRMEERRERLKDRMLGVPSPAPLVGGLAIELGDEDAK